MNKSNTFMILIFSSLIFSSIDGMGQPFVSLGRLIDPVAPSFMSHYFKSEEQKKLLYGILTSLLLTSPGLLMRNKYLSLGLPASVLAGSYLYNYLYPQSKQPHDVLSARALHPSVDTSKLESQSGSSQQQYAPEKLDEDLERIHQDASLYEMINVSSSASKEEIAARIKVLNIKFHPDNIDRNSSLKKQIENKKWDNADVFKALQRIQSILLDDQMRDIYDSQGYEAAEAFMQNKEENQDQVSDEVRAEIPFIVALNKNYMDVITDFTLNKKISLTDSDKKLIEETTKKNNQAFLEVFANLSKYFSNITMMSKDTIINLVSRVLNTLTNDDYRQDILKEWKNDLQKNGYNKQVQETVFNKLENAKSDFAGDKTLRRENDGGMANID